MVMFGSTTLSPDRIVDSINRGESPDSLRSLVANYDGVVGNPTLSSIRSSGGFARLASC